MPRREPPTAWGAVERTARGAYGRLVAALAYRFRDIAAAEDALSDALRLALERWPTDGVPRSPEAWLTTVAKNRLRGGARHRAMTADPRMTAALESMVEGVNSRSGVAVDNRLNLMFVCAHPAIDPSLRTPLMLQTVLGLDAARIARVFLVEGPTMSQRLVRAKQKIRDAGVPFDTPEGDELGPRLAAVLEGIYAAYGAGWEDIAGAATRTTLEAREPLVEEALFLAQLLRELVPREPEALGLLALLRFSHARRRARFDDSGVFIPLARHDLSLWDREAILQADALLVRAASLRRPGPFQFEAAIQSAHCQRLFSGRTPWSAIVILYDALNRNWATVGSVVAHAAALAESGDATAAGARLEALSAPQVAAYAPYWVVLARVAELRQDPRARASALLRAIALTRDAALRTHLDQQLRGADAAEPATRE